MSVGVFHIGLVRGRTSKCTQGVGMLPGQRPATEVAGYLYEVRLRGLFWIE
ncbi:MAG TPA: hypothetical protein VEW94_08305 [Chloroflexia bacterium]|nr:hypothetical protein [Chloroflexia bacterium]